jgi:hypothetical protein
MKTKIYIASSWKNQHAVEMLTAILRARGFMVYSWIENNFEEWYSHEKHKHLSFEEWMKTESASKAFSYDTNGAMKCDICIYLGPAGKDAAAEVGMAFGAGNPILGLYAKGEDFGLMRKMMLAWFDRHQDLISYLDEHYPNLKAQE